MPEEILIAFWVAEFSSKGKYIAVTNRTVIKKIKENIKKIIDKYSVEKIILGLPKNMNGSFGMQAQKALSFAEKLKSSFQLPVELEDERLSTSKAEKFLIETDRSRKKRKKVIDKMSAVIILQSFLDRRMMNKEIKR